MRSRALKLSTVQGSSRHVEATPNQRLLLENLALFLKGFLRVKSQPFKVNYKSPNDFNRLGFHPLYFIGKNKQLHTEVSLL